MEQSAKKALVEIQQPEKPKDLMPSTSVLNKSGGPIPPLSG